jgi:hypothetical protein
MPQTTSICLNSNLQKPTFRYLTSQSIPQTPNSVTYPTKCTIFKQNQQMINTLDKYHLGNRFQQNQQSAQFKKKTKEKQSQFEYHLGNRLQLETRTISVSTNYIKSIACYISKKSK